MFASRDWFGEPFDFSVSSFLSFFDLIKLSFLLFFLVNDSWHLSKKS